MEMVGTCINCLPYSASVAINIAVAVMVLAIAVYQTA
jgi:hypothetical protein